MSRTWHHGYKARRRKFGDNYFWMNTPSWWIHDFMTVKQRAQVRTLIQRTMKLANKEDAPLFPLPKKPHQYYW